MKKLLGPVMTGAIALSGLFLGYSIDKVEAATIVRGGVTATTTAYMYASIKSPPLYTINNKGKKVLVTVAKGSTAYLYTPGWFRESIKYTKYTLVRHAYVPSTVTTMAYFPAKYVKVVTPPAPKPVTLVQPGPVTPPVSSAPTGGTAPVTTPPATPDATQPALPALASGQMYYKVLATDTEQSIAAKYQMNPSDLQAMNPQITNWTTLAANQQIIVATPSSVIPNAVVNSNITAQMQANFIAQVAPLAIQAWQQYQILPSLTIAQSILESHWGQSWLAINAQNYFGIKSSAGWSGDTINMPTIEYDTNGNLYVENDYFRKYATLSDSLNDHTQFLLKPRYANLIGVTDYMIATQNIWQDGYATDPSYPASLQKVIQQNNLVQYDILAGAVRPQ